MNNVVKLPTLNEWGHFDSYVKRLKRQGWKSKEGVDGPDARCWRFERDDVTFWLVFDDVIGGSLKAEDPSLDLNEINRDIESTPEP